MEKELLEIGRQLERAQIMFMEGVVDMDTLKVRTAPLEARRQELTEPHPRPCSCTPASPRPIRAWPKICS